MIGKEPEAECPGKCIIDWGCDEPYACEDCEDSPYRVYEDDWDYDVDERKQAVIDIIRFHNEALERVDNNV